MKVFSLSLVFKCKRSSWISVWSAQVPHWTVLSEEKVWIAQTSRAAKREEYSILQRYSSCDLLSWYNEEPQCVENYSAKCIPKWTRTIQFNFTLILIIHVETTNNHKPGRKSGVSEVLIRRSSNIHEIRHFVLLQSYKVGQKAKLHN